MSNSKLVGKKNDNGKLRMSLIPLIPLEEVIKVLEHGASKYGEFNWETVPNAETRYYDAAMRHLFAWKKGEKLDPDSNLPHLAHAICSLLFIISKESK